MYFECWLPRPQTMDTELLSLNVSTVCLHEHMHGQLLPHLNYVFAVNIQIKQLANLQIIEIPIELHESYIKIFYVPAYVASLGQAYEKNTPKPHTQDRTHKSQLQAAYNQKDIILQCLPGVIYHHFIEHSTI